MKRILRSLALAAALTLAGCADPEVVVETGVARLPVRILPFDRRTILDSLRTEAPPEPVPPPALVDRERALRDAEREWRAVERRWLSLDDSVSVLATRLRRARRLGGPDAATDSISARLGILEARRGEVKQSRDAAAARLRARRARDQPRIDSLRLAREAWTEAAFADYPERHRARLRALHRPELADTTGTDGIARFRVPHGRWWLDARLAEADTLREWNVPVVVGRRGARIRIE